MDGRFCKVVVLFSKQGFYFLQTRAMPHRQFAILTINVSVVSLYAFCITNELDIHHGFLENSSSVLMRSVFFEPLRSPPLARNLSSQFPLNGSTPLWATSASSVGFDRRAFHHIVFVSSASVSLLSLSPVFASGAASFDQFHYMDCIFRMCSIPFRIQMRAGLNQLKTFQCSFNQN